MEFKLEDELPKAISRELGMAKQKSQILWDSLGNKNIALFHNTIEYNKARTLIHCI